MRKFPENFLMEKEFALFIADLEFGLKNTHQAEDRPIYKSYLAGAACILSKVILKAPSEELYKAIDSFEHLMGWSFLSDSVEQKHPNSYKKFKELARYPE